MIEEIRRKARALENRDIQLWSINVLVILVVTAGLLALLLPNVMWQLGTVRLDGRYIPQLFFGFIVLIVLFNAYILEQRQALRAVRQDLFSQLIRAGEATELALIDPVTEIFNRRYLDQILSREVDRAERQKSSLTFLLIDVNDFKSVNARYGQLGGDRLLNSVGQLLLATFRRSDALVRYGNDEFLVLMADTNEQQAQRAVERLLAKVDAWNRDNSLPGYRLSLSCGLARYEKGTDVSASLEAAEQRMKMQKAARSKDH